MSDKDSIAFGPKGLTGIQPTGWTAERLANSLDENGIIRTTNLINAALAAERDYGNRLTVQLEEAQQQLAAEREKSQKLIEYGVKLDNWNDELQERLEQLETEVRSKMP